MDYNKYSEESKNPFEEKPGRFGNFHPIESILKIIKAEIPSYRSKRFHGQIGVGIFMIFIGVSVSMISMSITMGLFPCLIGLCLIGMGLAYKKTVLNGYDIVTGTIIAHNKFFPGRNAADGYVLQTEDGQISIPTQKRKGALPIGTSLRVYIAKNVASYENSNATVYGSVLGYDVVLDSDSEE